MFMKWREYILTGRKAGVTEAELADAMGNAIALNAYAAYSYAMRTLEAYQQLGQDTN